MGALNGPYDVFAHGLCGLGLRAGSSSAKQLGYGRSISSCLSPLGYEIVVSPRGAARRGVAVRQGHLAGRRLRDSRETAAVRRVRRRPAAVSRSESPLGAAERSKSTDGPDAVDGRAPQGARNANSDREYLNAGLEHVRGRGEDRVADRAYGLRRAPLRRDCETGGSRTRGVSRSLAAATAPMGLSVAAAGAVAQVIRSLARESCAGFYDGSFGAITDARR